MSELLFVLSTKGNAGCSLTVFTNVSTNIFFQPLFLLVKFLHLQKPCVQVCNITVKIEAVKYEIFNIIELGNKGLEDIGEIIKN